MSRQIVSYDDITLPYDSSSDQRITGTLPPAKKRKKNNQRAKQVNDTPCQPSHAVGATIPRDTDPKIPENTIIEGVLEYDEEESRELTHEEIWDDSALVDAWEAAQQEYEMYHGAKKNWKNEPLKNSPLWYNLPVDQTANAAQLSTSEDIDPDSRPLNFDTFVPTHDPSLPVPAVDPPPTYGDAAGSMVSQDEAFSRAMTAMYWGGYWTAVYHCQRHLSNPSAHNTGEADEDEGEDKLEEAS